MLSNAKSHTECVLQGKKFILLCHIFFTKVVYSALSIGDCIWVLYICKYYFLFGQFTHSDYQSIIASLVGCIIAEVYFTINR